MAEEKKLPRMISVAGRTVNWMLGHAGYEIVQIADTSGSKADIYDQDRLLTTNNHDFMKDPRFIAAYECGLKADTTKAWRIHWRVHVALWAAQHGARLEGDFVECGVNKGLMSSCIMQYLDWNSRDKHFFLFDTFKGIDPKYLNERENELGKMQFSAGHYSECYELAKENFKTFDRTHLVRGSVPDTLETVDIGQVCYLSIDMNCAAPEIAAAEHFWPKMTRGAVGLLDDYGFAGYEEQKKAFDAFAARKGIEILSLPTGQGMYVKS